MLVQTHGKNQVTCPSSRRPNLAINQNVIVGLGPNKFQKMWSKGVEGHVGFRPTLSIGKYLDQLIRGVLRVHLSEMQEGAMISVHHMRTCARSRFA
jgi:hypothetical protein